MLVVKILPYLPTYLVRFEREMCMLPPGFTPSPRQEQWLNNAIRDRTEGIVLN